MTHRLTRVDRETRTPPWAEYGIVTVENGAINVSLRAIPLDIDAVKAQVPATMPHRDDFLDYWSAPAN